MKNVPGWEVGKFNGEPVYNNIGGHFPTMALEEYYAHNKWHDMNERLLEKKKH